MDDDKASLQAAQQLLAGEHAAARAHTRRRCCCTRTLQCERACEAARGDGRVRVTRNALTLLLRCPCCDATCIEHLAELKGVDGVVSVQRVVCGGCRDFKIITKVNADKFGAFEADGFAGEAAFLDKLGAVSGLSHVETQTYTLEDM